MMRFYGVGAWLLSILRPLRVLAYREAHRKLLGYARDCPDFS